MTRGSGAPHLTLLGTLVLFACTTSLDRGERLYREGNHLAALAAWRSVPPDATNHPRVQARIEAVELEFEQLVVRYKKRGRYFERKDRLAESILNYRLALRLQPDDHETLEHVQHLARTLAGRKDQRRRALEEAFATGELAQARRELAALREFDPFDAELESVERRLDERLDSEVDRLLTRGRRGFTSGNLLRARGAFEEVLDLDPENASARGYLSYMAASQPDDEVEGTRRTGYPPAIQASEREIRAEGLHQNAMEATRRGRPYVAIEYEIQALDFDPRHEAARTHLADLRRQLAPEVARLIEEGRSHFQEEELESALDDWRRALLIDPDNRDARSYTARAQLLLRNLDELRSEAPSPGDG
jgi:tetratricopeptide (TPR) repeat protein